MPSSTNAVWEASLGGHLGEATPTNLPELNPGLLHTRRSA